MHESNVSSQSGGGLSHAAERDGSGEARGARARGLRSAFRAGALGVAAALVTGMGAAEELDESEPSDPFSEVSGEASREERESESSEPVEESTPPRTAGSLQLSAGFRYGVMQDDDADVDPWRTGLGLSLGYTTYDGLYVGGVFDYFLGETLSIGEFEVSANVWQLAGEVGYDFMLGSAVMLRPKVSAGVSTLNVECSPGCIGDGSDSYVGVAPGLTAQFYAGRVILAVDARYQLVFADPETAKALILSFGIGF